MNIEKSWLWFGLKGCLYCGSLLPQSDGLCRPCSESLWQWAPDDQLFHQRLEKMEVLSLFEWIPGLQEVLSRLVRALKGPGGEEIWGVYAEEFWRRHLVSKLPRRGKKYLFIPSPSKGGVEDHALILARRLAELMCGEVCTCLARDRSSQSQKKKSRSQRFRVTMEWAENFTPADFRKQSVGKTLVFVDDVLTTGATARAAWKTLGKPRDFAVWTLAQRSLACGEPSDLL